MLKKDMTKAEIVDELRGKGDFVKIDYLMRFIRNDAPLDKKKYAYVLLSEVYAGRKMFDEAARALDNAALATTIYSEKANLYGEESLMFARAGDFDSMERAKKKAFANVSGDVATFRARFVFELAKTVRSRADELLEEDRKNNARIFMEKLLTMQGISEQEKRDVSKTLLRLYESLGKFREAELFKGKFGL